MCFILQLLFFYRETSVIAYDSVWHHICVTWKSSSGAWQFFKDGDLEVEGEDFKKDYTIPSHGVLYLGQQNDASGSGFVTDQSLQGMLSNVNVWDNVLPATQIKAMSKSCLEEWHKGNIYKWSDILPKGGHFVQLSPCEPLGK